MRKHPDGIWRGKRIENKEEREETYVDRGVTVWTPVGKKRENEEKEISENILAETFPSLIKYVYQRSSMNPKLNKFKENYI